MLATGIVLSIVAMLSWGFGDFWIQKNTRKIGNWATLFFVTLFGAVVLFPFSINGLGEFFRNIAGEGIIILLASVVLLLAAIIDFEALRKGKLAVVEPIWSFEVPVTALLAFFILSEAVSVLQIVLIVLLLAFLMLVSFRERKLSKKSFLEKGVFLAFMGAIAMGCANFFMGWGARVTDPVVVNFITDFFIMAASAVVLISRGKVKQTIKDAKENLGPLLQMSIADKVAWLAFAFAMVTAPIAIATALSQSYIIVAVVLGMAVNKEKLFGHQKIGLVGAIVVAVILAVMSAN